MTNKIMDIAKNCAIFIAAVLVAILLMLIMMLALVVGVNAAIIDGDIMLSVACAIIFFMIPITMVFAWFITTD